MWELPEGKRLLLIDTVQLLPHIKFHKVQVIGVEVATALLFLENFGLLLWMYLLQY